MNENNTFYCSFVSNHYIVCECGEAYESEDALREHLVKDRLRHQQLIESKELLVLNEYRCGTCDEIFDTEEECLEHQESSHLPHLKVEAIKAEIKEEKEDIEEFIQDAEEIDLTGYMFVPREQYINTTFRMRSRQSKIKKEVESPPKSRQVYHYKNVICEVCGKRYASNAALQYHQRVHSGVRPYPCMYCPKRFTMRLFQQIHMRIHTGEKPYQCENCPKAFTNKAALLRHERVHTGEKPFVCPKCGKAFSQSNSMKLHVHTVHLKMPAPYKSKKRKTKEEINKGMKEDENPVQLLTFTNDEFKTEECVTTDNEVYYCVEVATLDDLNMR
ncbi:unnamed protein product [Chilo suppressalis]|uniref:C2H2-type domain-containing protein n=1 Tax=Chilo suppressalis TaxID=168631 RepID=A0ABN8B737_CHISP|nr:unnamed protein product [Chilo suppressalis]